MNDNISPRCPRILLAEDDPPSRRVTQLMLEKLGYKIDVVANGLEALKAMEDKTYDLLCVFGFFVGYISYSITDLEGYLRS